MRALAADNDELDPRDRVTIDTIRKHTTRHFPGQQAARATYPQILERRAQENGIDFVKGTALTPLAFFEVVMHKAFRRLVSDDIEVGVDVGLRAAEKLRAVLDRNDQGDDIADMRRQVHQNP